MSESDPNWKFDQEKNVGAITTKQVFNDGLPILLAIHYGDDCSWAFLCDTTDDEDDSQLVTMEEIVAMDPSLEEIADLPPGWIAFRDHLGDKWERMPEEEE